MVLKIVRFCQLILKKVREICKRMDFEGSVSKKEKYSLSRVEFIPVGAVNQRFWIRCTSLNRWH